MTRRAPILLAVLAAAGLSACASNAGPAAAPAATPPAGAYPVTVGGVTLTAQPTRIISLSPSATDMLFSIGAGAQVIEVDKDSDYFGTPAPARTPPADVDPLKPNAEALAAKNPDLVVVSGDDNKIKDQLAQLKIPVYLAAAAVTLDDTYAQETDLGALTGHVAAAATVVANEKKAISDALAGMPSRAKPLTFYYELDPTLYSVTSKTFIGSLFTMAGMTDIADPSDADGKAGGYPQLSAEAVLKADPDLIFLADAGCCQQTEATIAARPGWSTLSAVRDHHVIADISDDVASQWGTRVPQLLLAIVTAAKSVPTS